VDPRKTTKSLGAFGYALAWTDAAKGATTGTVQQIARSHASCLSWLHEREIAVLGSDGVSDVQPSRVDAVPMPIHTVAIVAMGVHLLDNLDLDELSVACTAAGRWSFQLAVAPLVLHQGTASPVNPIAVL